MDCGPACLRMIAKHYGRSYSLYYLRHIAHLDREGVSLAGLGYAAHELGFRTMVAKTEFESSGDSPCLLRAPLPLIAHWKQRHFLVVYKLNTTTVWVSDPAIGRLKISRVEFEKYWGQEGGKGVVMLLEPSPEFYQHEADEAFQAKDHADIWDFALGYLRPHFRLFGQLLLGLAIGIFFQMALPFMTQMVVDVGIQGKSLNLLTLILFGQFALFFGQVIVKFIQSWIMLHISTRVNIGLLSDFLSRMMRLPLAYFDSKMTGDLLQRVGDHQRIQTFLTQSSLSLVFAVINFFIFSIMLLFYDEKIFYIFILSALFYAVWIAIFMRKRKNVDYRMFHLSSENNNSLIEMIQGMPEIKLQNSQDKRRWLWTAIQAKLFRVQLHSLALSQYQDAGGHFINRLKDVFITYYTAKLVIDGHLTLGGMMAVQYIMGQVNAPLEQFIIFIRSAQDAKLSWDRIAEVHRFAPEESPDVKYLDHIPEGDICLENVSFRYNEIGPLVLEDINIRFPRGKVTAIVGASGSGKTTLIKLLLGFYKPVTGKINIGRTSLDMVRPTNWRDACGAVMQDGFVFSDTIGNNIAESDSGLDTERLWKATETANIRDYVEQLPLRYNTKIGASGNGLSQGQRQRLLIARSIYKNPEFLFFDEATNALDAHNERAIVENLRRFYQGRTVIVVAHRLSTVRDADQIIVLGKGQIIEQGAHFDLVDQEGEYYRLVKNQLELGS